MREQLNCLQAWLSSNRTDGSAYKLFCALVSETLKRVDSLDPGQREFDAGELAPAAEGPSDFEAGKRWIDRAKLELFSEARRPAIEAHFRAAGHSNALRVKRRSPAGKHRAVWFLESYALPDSDSLPTDTDASTPAPAQATSAETVTYDVTTPGAIKAAWYARPLLGAGGFVTKSWRGIVFAGLLILSMCLLAGISLTSLAYAYLQRPLMTSDLASLILLGALGWATWRMSIRPATRLLDDRITLASDLWLGWREEPAQLELVRDENRRQHIRLVRYTSVCPICASAITLRYSVNPGFRELVGCCSEVPYEHMFTFDRVLRRGTRIRPAWRS